MQTRHRRKNLVLFEYVKRGLFKIHMTKRKRSHLKHHLTHT